MSFSIDMIFLVVSILAGIALVLLQPSTQLYLKLLVVYLLLVLAVESIAAVMIAKGMYTTVLYNFFTIIEFDFYFFIVAQVIYSRVGKKIILHAIWAYSALALSNVLFLQKINTFHSVTFALGCFLTVVFSIYYFFQLFQFPYAIKLVKEPSFWICTALLFYFCCIFPLFAYINFMSKIPQFIIRNYQALIEIFNTLLYSLFAAAFLCRIKVPKLT